MNLAGAQVRNKTTGEVIVMLKKVIETMIEEGEINEGYIIRRC